MKKIETTILLIYSSLVGFACCLLFFFDEYPENSLKINNMEKDNLNEPQSPALQQCVVSNRLFAVMTDDYVILKLFWKKEDADKELETYKREHKDELFFVEEVDIH